MIYRSWHFTLGKAVTLHASYWCFFQLDCTVGIFFLKWIFPQGLNWYYFHVALDVILINMLKAKHLKNKHLPFFKWLIPLTCHCHVHVHTQQPLQWVEYVERRSKKSNHDNECLESGLRHGLISSVHSPPPSHLSPTPSSASLPRLEHACAAPILCPPLPHLPDLIWRRSRCYGEIEGGWEKASPPRLMTPAPFLSSLCWNSFSAAARLKPDESRKHHRSQRQTGDGLL